MKDDYDQELLYRTDERVEQMQRTMTEGFDSVEKKLDQNFGELKETTTIHDQRLDRLDKTVSRNTTILGGIATAVGGVFTLVISKLSSLFGM